MLFLPAPYYEHTLVYLETTTNPTVWGFRAYCAGSKLLDNASRVLGFEVLVVGATFEKSPQAVH